MSSKTLVWIIGLIILSSLACAAPYVKLGNASTSGVNIIIAAEPDYYFKAGNDIMLKIPCYTSDNSLCASTVVCALTVNYPSGDNLMNNKTMTNSISYYSYVLNRSNASVLGVYNGFVNCDDPSGDNGFREFTFEVNPAGKQLGDNALFALMFGVGIVAILFFYFAFNLSEEHFLLKILFIFLGLGSLMIVPTVYTVGDYIAQSVFLRLPQYAFWMFSLYFSVYLVYYVFKNSEKMMAVFGRNKE